MTLATIHSVLCEYYEIEKETIFDRSRERFFIEKRQIFHYLSRRFTKKSHNTIANYYSDITNITYTHSSIIHSVKKVKGYVLYDKALRHDVNSIIDELLAIKTTAEITNDKSYLNNVRIEIIKSITNAKTLAGLQANLQTRQDELSEILV